MTTLSKIKIAGFVTILLGTGYFLIQFFAPKPVANLPSNSSSFVNSLDSFASSSFINSSFTSSSSKSKSSVTSSGFSSNSSSKNSNSSSNSSKSSVSKISSSLAQKNDEVSLNTEITGNNEVDLYIQKLAEARGYKVRQEAKSKSLSPEMKNAIAKVQANAKKDGLNLVLVSGFRSISDQKALFLRDYNTKNFSQEEVLSGKADRHIDNILSTRSIPGYSKHHTGNTVDFGCNNSDLLGFKNTKCFEWLRKNNYANAKTAGLDPSYPPTGEKMGPNPEEWEYVLQ